MKKLNFDAPINGLSLGNVAVNFLRELKKREIDIFCWSMFGTWFPQDLGVRIGRPEGIIASRVRL